MAFMMSAISCSCATAKLCGFSSTSLPQCVVKRREHNAYNRPQRSRGSNFITHIGWDPEGILAPPQPGHIARRMFTEKFKSDEEAKEALEKQAQDERERRRAAREARVVPESDAALVEYLLDTEGQDMEFEIARCRPRLHDEFFTYFRNEIGSLRFSSSRTTESDDRLVELEALQKVLVEGRDAYDSLAERMIGAKDRLAKILAAKDKRATLLELAGENMLDRPLLALLDQNIAAAAATGQEDAAKFMGKIRAAVVKYMTF